MKFLVGIFFTAFCIPASASPIDCKNIGINSVVVSMAVPHPLQAIVYRPSGEVVWVQHQDLDTHPQIQNFGNLETWKIDSNAVGTVFREGKPVIEPILTGAGKYHLYIAENTETERNNTYFIECYFDIGEETHNKRMQSDAAKPRR